MRLKERQSTMSSDKFTFSRRGRLVKLSLVTWTRSWGRKGEEWLGPMTRRVIAISSAPERPETPSRRTAKKMSRTPFCTIVDVIRQSRSAPLLLLSRILMVSCSKLSPIQEHFDRGYKAYEKGDFTSAVLYLKRSEERRVGEERIARGSPH